MLINIVDVVDGALVNAIALTGRRVSVAVDGLRGRRRATDLTAARWILHPHDQRPGRDRAAHRFLTAPD